MRQFREATTKEYRDILQGGATKKLAILMLPEGRANFGHLLRCSSLPYLKVRITPRALDMTKIDSVKLILVQIPDP